MIETHKTNLKYLCYSLGHVELSLPVYVPGVVTGGSAPYNVTLYEHLVVHLCSAVALFPPENFSTTVCSFQSQYDK